MRNIPLFTTEAGVAGLVLEEIPYKREAYIRILNTTNPKQLLEDCVGFCRSAGAEHIYASGNEILETFPLHTAILRMTCARDRLKEGTATLVAVNDERIEEWREIYNIRMQAVPNASTMTVGSAQKLLETGDAYFVYRKDALLGIGKASDCKVDVVISVIPGEGEEIVLALNSALIGDIITVEVSSANLPAVKLYERMGFLVTEELSRWYQVM